MTASHKKSARRTGGRPPQKLAEQILDNILAVASRLFLKHGYGAVSVEMIANEAGISKRTFYHRFDDKAALFSSVVRQLTDGMRPPGVDHLFEGDNLHAMLLTLAQVIIHAAITPEALALTRLLLAEAGRFPEPADIMNKGTMRQEAIDRIGRLLEHEAKGSHVRIDNPSFAAEQFLQLIVASPQRRALAGVPMSEAELKNWVKDSVQLFLHGCSYKA